MALDSTWQADIGVQVRGLTDIDGRQLSVEATGLARTTSEEWVRLLGDHMGRGGGRPVLGRGAHGSPARG